MQKVASRHLAFDNCGTSRWQCVASTRWERRHRHEVFHQTPQGHLFLRLNMGVVLVWCIYDVFLFTKKKTSTCLQTFSKGSGIPKLKQRGSELFSNNSPKSLSSKRPSQSLVPERFLDFFEVLVLWCLSPSYLDWLNRLFWGMTCYPVGDFIIKHYKDPY